MPDAEPSSPRDPSLWREHAQMLVWADELRATVLAARHDDDAAQLLVIAAERAALTSLDSNRQASTQLWAALREGATCGTAAALCASRHKGAALVRLADGHSRPFPVGGLAGMTAPRWALALALASCCDDKEALHVLAHPLAVLASQEPAEVADAFWTPSCVALAALHRGEAAATALLRDAVQALDPPRIADPGFVACTRAPVLRLALCLAEGDAGEAQVALADALRAHAQWYGDGPGRGERMGLLAFELAGLCALARRRGLMLQAGSDLLPQPAHDPAGDTAQPSLEFVFPPMQVLDDGEPHWFLDLHGFPRSGRHHEVGTVHTGVLVADYTAQDAPGLPRSRARFALQGEGSHACSWPMALELSELRTLHAALLEAARAVRGQAGAALHDETRAMAACIQRHEQVLAATATIAGKGPGRPSDSGVPEHADPAGAAGAHTTDNSGAARTAALAVAHAISQQLHALLQALGQDRDGALALTLQPRHEDYALAFTSGAAETARLAYEAMWHTLPRMRLTTPGTRLVMHLAPAGMLGYDNELSREFPGGYRSIAHLLDPRRVWVSWKLIPPGQDTGMAYDGLVWLDDHWAWFPKPYRMLQSLLRS